MSGKTPLVSICCLTYNHAPFIKQCLEGFLMQKVNFDIEVLIHDDASTDGTIGILKEYEEKYPGVILPLFEKENQYSKGKASQMDLFNYRRARGKYIAYCEGDDYWTDPLKLQKQVDFMEANPEYTICFTRFMKLLNDGTYIDDLCAPFLEGHPGGIDIDVETYFKSWITQGLTTLFRKDAFSYEWAGKTPFYRDFFEYYFLITVGKGRLMNFVSGVYRISGEGVYTTMNNFSARQDDVNVSRSLWEIERDEPTRLKFIRTLQYIIEVYCQDKSHKKDLYRYALEQFSVSKDIKMLVKNIKRLL